MSLLNRTQATWRTLAWLPISFVVLLLDQLSKYAALTQLQFSEPKVVLPFLNFTLIYNKGVSFGFMHDLGGAWQQGFFISTTLLISGILLYWLYHLPRTQVLTAFALTLILGGAFGNLIDRIRFGHVIDFISFHLGGWYFAVFNLADAAISVGAALILLEILFERKMAASS